MVIMSKRTLIKVDLKGRDYAIRQKPLHNQHGAGFIQTHLTIPKPITEEMRQRGWDTDRQIKVILNGTAFMQLIHKQRPNAPRKDEGYLWITIPKRIVMAQGLEHGMAMNFKLYEKDSLFVLSITSAKD